MAAVAPVHQKRRRESCVLVLLRCACGYLERWPLPIGARVLGRCTCPRCGEQLHEDLEAPAIDSARLR